MYKATYTRKNGRLPQGVEVQFISDRYGIDMFHFQKNLLNSRNFKKEIVETCRKMFGVDISIEIDIPGNDPFAVECISYNQKYRKR